jgi:hypothetical protein
VVHAQVQSQTDLETKSILVLHSFEGNAPIFLRTDKGLLDRLSSGGISSQNQFFESLDLRRNPGPAHRKMLVEQMRVRYGHRKFDMIITMFPESLDRLSSAIRANSGSRATPAGAQHSISACLPHQLRRKF